MANIKPTIEGGEVVRLEVNSQPLTLRSPFPVLKLPDLIQAITYLEEWVDWGGRLSWTPDKVRVFLLQMRPEIRTFFALLSKREDWVERQVVEEHIGITGRILGDKLSSPGQYFNTNLLERLYEKRMKWDGEKFKYAYRIVPKYLAIVCEGLMEVEE